MKDKPNVFVRKVDVFIQTMLTTYAPDGSTGKIDNEDQRKNAMLAIRSNFIAHAGTFLLSMGQKMAAEEQKSMCSNGQAMSPEAKLHFIADQEKDKLFKAEQHIRKELVEKGLYSIDQLPKQVYAEAKPAKPEEEQKCHVIGASIKAPTPTLGRFKKRFKNQFKKQFACAPNSHIHIIPTSPPHVIGARPRARTLGWGRWDTRGGGWG